METPEETKTLARRKRVEADPRYQSVDEALKAKHDQMTEYLKGTRLDQLKALQPKSKEGKEV